MSIQTDLSKLLDLLKAHPIVTAKEARECGIQSPSARARELSEHGYPVVPCWRLQKPQTKKTPARTRVNKAKAGAVKPGKSSKPTSESVAAELQRARAALDGEV